MSKILVVEDDAPIREMLRIILLAEGHDVTLCKSGNEGIAALAQSGYDLLLLDMQMADGDGLSVLAWLREHPRALRVIVTTAQMAPLPVWAQSLIEGVLRKPYGVDDLLHRVAHTPAYAKAS